MREYLSHRLIPLDYYIYILRYLPTYHESDTDEGKEAECSDENTNTIIEMKDKHDFENFDEWEGISDESFEEWDGIADD